MPEISNAVFRIAGSGLFKLFDQNLAQPARHRVRVACRTLKTQLAGLEADVNEILVRYGVPNDRVGFDIPPELLAVVNSQLKPLLDEKVTWPADLKGVTHADLKGVSLTAREEEALEECGFLAEGEIKDAQ